MCSFAVMFSITHDFHYIDESIQESYFAMSIDQMESKFNTNFKIEKYYSCLNTSFLNEISKVRADLLESLKLRTFEIISYRKLWLFYCSSQSYSYFFDVSIKRLIFLNQKQTHFDIKHPSYEDNFSSNSSFNFLSRIELTLSSAFLSFSFFRCVTAFVHQHVARVCFKNKLFPSFFCVVCQKKERERVVAVVELLLLPLYTTISSENNEKNWNIFFQHVIIIREIF